MTNGLNELATVGGVAATYSSKGVLTTDPTTGMAYGYSPENLLISAPGTTFNYDGLMRLSQVTGASSAQFAYDGTDMIAEYQGGSVQEGPLRWGGPSASGHSNEARQLLRSSRTH